MRQKRRQLLMTFDTTAAAMAAEALFRREGLSGRLIPTPQAVTAECGLAWCAPPETRAALLRLTKAQGLSYRVLTELLM